MIDLTDKELNDHQVAAFVRMGVGLFHQHGKSYVSRNYWDNATEGMKLALVAVYDYTAKVANHG